MRPLSALMPLYLLAACSGAPDEAGTGANRASLRGSDDGAQHLGTVALRIRHGENRSDARLDVEIALTPDQQEKGLQHRTALKAGEGMLFPMIPPRMPSFWMKDTPVALDLVFIRTDGGIARIIPHAKPNDRTPLFAEEPVSGVLELRAGEAGVLGLDEGDRINWGTCTKAAQAEPVAEAENFCPA